MHSCDETGPDNAHPPASPPAAPERVVPPHFLTWVVTVATVLLLGLGSFSLIMQAYDQNESFCVTTGYLVSHGYHLYADFSFWQMPYSAELYGLVFRLCHTTHYLLTGKVISWLCLWLSALGIFGVAWRLARRFWLALGLAVIFLLNLTVMRCASEASNYILPMAFSIVAFYCAAVALSGSKFARTLWLIAGLGVAAASGTQLYYAPTLLAYGVVLLWYPRALTLRQRLAQGAIPFAAGAFIGLLPVAYLLLRDFDSFMFNNLRAPELMADWWRQAAKAALAGHRDLGAPLTLAEKLHYAKSAGLDASNCGLLLGAAAGLIVALALRLGKVLLAPVHTLALLLVAVSLPATFVPSPTWYQYFGLPLTFVLLWFTGLMALLVRERPRVVRLILFVAFALALFGTGRDYREGMRQLTKTKNWTGYTLHIIGQGAADQIPPEHNTGPLACWPQLFAVESGRFAPYLELAYAPYSCLIADRLTPEQRTHYHLVGPKELGALLTKRPPAAVLIGQYEDPVWNDATLSRWVTAHHYRPDDKFPFSNLYLPPIK